MEDGEKISPLLLKGIIGLRLTETGNSFIFGIQRKNDQVKPLKKNKIVLVDLTRYRFLWQNFWEKTLAISTIVVKEATRKNAPDVVLYNQYIILFDEAQDRFEFTSRLGKNSIQRDNSQVQPDSAYLDYNALIKATVRCKIIVWETEGKTKTRNSPFRRWVASTKGKLFRKEEAHEVVRRFPDHRSPAEHMVKGSTNVDDDEQPDPLLILDSTKGQDETLVDSEADIPSHFLSRSSLQFSPPLAQSTPISTEKGLQCLFQYTDLERTLANMERSDIPFTNEPNLPADLSTAEDGRLLYRQKKDMTLEDTGFQTTTSLSELDSEPEAPVTNLTSKFKKTEVTAKPAHRS